MQQKHAWRILTLSVFFFGMASLVSWWQIRQLGDPRLHLGAFYAWFAFLALVYLGMLGLAAWAQRQGMTAAKTLPALIAVLLTAGLSRLLVLSTAPTLSDDIYRYRWDGRVQEAGIDPYRYAPNDPALEALRDPSYTHINFPHLRTIYPPLTELAFRVGARLGGTLTAHKAVFVGAELLTVISLLVILVRRGRSPLWVAAYACHPLVILEVAGSGHNDALGIGLLWTGLAAWEAREWAGYTLAWSLAFLSKFASIILVPWWWWRRGERTWLGAFLVMALLPLMMHPSALSALFDSLSKMTGRVESNASIFLGLLWLFGASAAARLSTLVLWGGFLLWWSRREADPVRYLAGGYAAAALLSPAMHPWYLLWLIPAFCFWRPAWLLAWSGTVVLAYAVWPGYLRTGMWALPLWARTVEYAPVMVLGVLEAQRWLWHSSFLPATNPPLSARS